MESSGNTLLTVSIFLLFEVIHENLVIEKGMITTVSTLIMHSSQLCTV